MTSSSTASPAPRRVLVFLIVAGIALATPSPVAAQYGSSVELFVNETRVDIEGVFDYFGLNCPAGSTVTITIDGVPGILATTTASGDGSYSGTDVPMPAGVVAGQDYTVRGSCGGVSDIAVVRAVCNGGADPVGGNCPDGRNTSGQDGSTPTTTLPGSGPGPGPGRGGVDDGRNPNLAITGASFAEQIAQGGVTLVALGALVMLAASRRRDRIAE